MRGADAAAPRGMGMSESATDNNPASIIDALASYAIDFDEISAADGACYSAAAFVEWIRLESDGQSRAEDRTPEARAPSVGMRIETLSRGYVVRQPEAQPFTLSALRWCWGSRRRVTNRPC